MRLLIGTVARQVTENFLKNSYCFCDIEYA